MDFITSAIASAVGSLGLEGVQHGYNKLKALLQSKFGEDSALAEAVEQFEKNPESAARKAVVAEELAKVRGHQDEEVLAVAKQLLELLTAVQPQGDVFSGSGKQVNVTGEAQIGVLGDNTEVKGGIHFGGK
ncbi:MAG: hypothetical protein D3903_13140 [Candidatus Electrothrix sp. GM3_4]|nr:hypothetical protein [Candidatus Electrothrix sp. GM3_4]